MPVILDTGGGREKKIGGSWLKASQGKKGDPISIIPNKKKRAGGVAQVVQIQKVNIRKQEHNKKRLAGPGAGGSWL
jgi:hypothetical protein